ncbi:MAG TPA: hypothetical protein VEU62_01170 [Bryobacterales bacterium]|nr:hypothetical protein [Bryobacterales bacterium]
MRIARAILLLASLLPIGAECEQSYRVYTEHPRLWLDARRLRLLRRERERDSIRWQQLQLLVKSGQALPEEPLVEAFEYQVAQDEPAGRQATAWAVKRAGVAGDPDAEELRRLAVVLDWCYPLFGEAERAAVVKRMARGIAQVSAQNGIRPFASAALAAIAVADDWPGSEQALAAAFEKRWRQALLPRLREGRALDAPEDRVAFLEMCHAVRNNLQLDLWEQAPAYFKQFPYYLLLQYYPAPVTVGGHRFRQPSQPSSARPDPAVAGQLARVAELLTAAYDTNSVETQFLQGWITHDIYRLRAPSGALYEFLWMNPYQPGLSYYNVPLHLYDELGGRLWARSSWDDDATWVGYFDGELQLFADGKPTVINSKLQPAPIVFPQAAVVAASGEASFKVLLTEGEDVYVVGLEPGKTYWVKSGAALFVPRTAGKGGILSLQVETGTETAFELKASDPNPPAPAMEGKKKKRK